MKIQNDDYLSLDYNQVAGTKTLLRKLTAQKTVHVTVFDETPTLNQKPQEETTARDKQQSNSH